MGENAVYSVLGYLPNAMEREIRGILRGARLSVREIRLRAFGVSSLVTDLGGFPLYSRVCAAELEKITEGLCRGSAYAYLECIKAGYIPLSRGVRVGIVGEARYKEGGLVGISAISSLCFRIPCAACDLCGELYGEWRELGEENLLILAPPSGGKTTALRSLARKIGTGRSAKRVVVIDERCEFDPEDYVGASVDILQGYRRGVGTEIAVRTMSPEVLLVDEITTAEDAEALRTALGVGIPVIATAHGTHPRSLLQREQLASLIRSGAFSLFCSIRRQGAGFLVSRLEKIAV
ncbi:MAG: hypothetical protein IKL79_02380 [Clostridia bacterium]|nr:hypothetical protein [Clostridia bacterium]